ncbi:LysM peptidoglycan-binding domain-containing M23 family metallopeptidase [Paenibacillus agricola]|uniref:Peptidoglycan DD-metalloendopeptidase family protein n=1 Tax=Paenibacillus agricola TaxID=2716264 RepID=A0ABX0J3E4_9BACL|nr:M23 family metallopeptidase [Paenibacillus agricola]NHN30892.1 peptidoglycan DD-metalloendopeptidase family protein [Paenibacillus agricola]
MDYTTSWNKFTRLWVGCTCLAMLIMLGWFHVIDSRKDEQKQLNQPVKGLANEEAINEELDKMREDNKRGIQIRIDGKPLGMVRNEAAAMALLERYKQDKVAALAAQGKIAGAVTAEEAKVYADTDGDAYPIASKAAVHILTVDQGRELPRLVEQELLHEVQFVQQIELTAMDVGTEAVSDEEALLNKLAAGESLPVLYKVLPGDCVSCIAAKFKLDQAVIYSNNPQVAHHKLQIGEELDLTVLRPLLSLKTIEQRIVSAEVPFNNEYIEDAALATGVQEVVTAGVPGLKQMKIQTTRIDGELIREEQIEETIVRPATQALVKKGTKRIPGIGNGQFVWPVYRAKLTSGYGSRWGGFHPGMDLQSEQSGIMASDHGSVSFAGWKTGYGNCIIIDHHNGYSTLYGHLSKISVDVDERIQKGDKIGIMGDTGQATGVHLHFEIRKGDKQENPLDFLSQAS